MCNNQPLEKCETVPRQQCTQKHKKVPVRISKNIPKKVCDNTDTDTGTGYGYTSNTEQPANPDAEVILDIKRSHTNTNNQKSNKIVFADK